MGYSSSFLEGFFLWLESSAHFFKYISFFFKTYILIFFFAFFFLKYFLAKHGNYLGYTDPFYSIYCHDIRTGQDNILSFFFSFFLLSFLYLTWWCSYWCLLDCIGKVQLNSTIIMASAKDKLFTLSLEEQEVQIWDLKTFTNNDSLTDWENLEYPSR